MGEYQVDQYTVALLHFNGGITDESGKVWTAMGGATTSTAQSQFGGSSLYLNGTNQYLTTPNSTAFDFGSGDFTIDWWEYRVNGNPVFSRQPGEYSPIMLGYDLGYLGAYGSSTHSSWDILGALSMGTTILNAWTHYAFVRAGGYFYTFQNGKQISKSALVTIPMPAGTGTPLIGNYGGNLFKGYVDEFRISNIARWTSDFTPGGTLIPVPANLVATAGDAKVTLSWSAVTGATGYNVKRSTTAGGAYTTIASNVTGTSYEDDNVVNGTTYYYVVTALESAGESANSNEASATPQASGKAILVINMDDGRHEYDLTKSDVDAFIGWYDAKTGGAGAAYYVFSKSFNLGPFMSRKDYIVFDQIINFEVMSYQD